MDMTKFGRFNLPEITLKRLLSALKVRAREIPHMLAWKFLPFGSDNKERIKRYQGKHQGQRCFLVANGPSLKKTNLDLLSNEITFGLNRIYLFFDETSFRPTYYAALNELVLEQFSTEISKLDMPKFLNWNHRSYFDIHDPQVAFLKSNMVIHDYFQPNLVNPVVVGATVTFAALQIAYYMGFQQVILVGLDHKYSDTGMPNQTKVRTAERDDSHFHPGYFPKGIKWQLPDLLRSEIDFRIAREAFEKDGREIVDATIEGNCPVFRKVDYLSLFR